MITYKQAVISISTCQTLTNTLCSIELLRFDETRKQIYIFAITSRREEIEVTIDEDGERTYL